MIACRYGYRAGGAKPAAPRTASPTAGTARLGFTFKTYNANDMLYAIRRSLGAYANKTDWPVLVAVPWRQISAGAVPRPMNISSCTRR